MGMPKSTKQMSFLQKVRHHLMVQRGNGWKPLRDGSGEFIYKEADRHLAGRGPLSPKEEKAMQELNAEIEQEGRKALLMVPAFLAVLVVSVLLLTLVGPKSALASLVLGLFLFSKGLALAVFIVGVLALI